MSAVCNNRWELSVIIDDDDSSLIKIIDAGNVTGGSSTVLDIYGVNSIATNVTLDTNIPNGIKAQLLYGANGSDGDGGNKASGEFRFQPGTDQLTTELNTPLTQPPVTCDPATEESGKSPKEVFEEAVEDIYAGVEQTTVDKVKSSYNNLPEIQTELEKDDKGDDVLIPLNLSFDLEGIAGIPFGALLQGNYIPGVYKEYGDFMVTGVGHKIDASKWTTSIETIMKRKS